jgi:hypothetical protein
MSRFGFSDVDPNKLHGDVTLTTKQAMDLLGGERKYFVAYARWTGVRIIGEKAKRQQAARTQLTAIEAAARGPIDLNIASNAAIEACKKAIEENEPTVHSREVRARMVEEGILDGYTGADFWLGTVFNSGPWEPTGRRHKYTDNERNIHDREVRIWKLKEGAAADAYVEPKQPDEIVERHKAYHEMAQTKKVK